MRKTILVTAIGSFSSAAVIDRCKKENYRVLGCDIYPAQWIVASGEVEEFFQAPLATDRKAFCDFLEKICKEEHVDFVIPLTDVEVDALQEWRQKAEELGVILCMSGYDTIEVCRNKEKLANFLEPFKICRIIPGRNLAQMVKEEEDTRFELLDYPLILKPSRGRSSQGLTEVKNAKEMRYRIQGFGDDLSDYLVQPKIPGTVITVDVVRNPVTKQIRCLPRREYLRTKGGAGTSVYVFQDAVLEEQCMAVARALNIWGCVNFEFVEKEEQEWYLLECNPRFSGGTAFSSMAGYDMVKNHLRCFTGEGLEPMGEIKGQYLVKRYQEYRMES